MSTVPNGFARGNYPKPHDATVELFWSKVDKSGGPDACWPWTGATLRQKSTTRTKPYGKFAYRVNNHRTHIAAHRFAVIASGTEPGTLAVLHKCDNPPCCNPAHLFLGTNADNCRDRVSKNRQARAADAGKMFASPILRFHVLEIRAAHGDRAALQAFAARYGMAFHSIYKIARGDCFGWVT